MSGRATSPELRGSVAWHRSCSATAPPLEDFGGRNMSRLSTSLRLATACALVLIAHISLHAQGPAFLHAQGPVAALCLKFGNETVPPGGIVQAKLFVTEPMPISTATAAFSFGGVESLEGIALLSPARDALGVAVVRGSEMVLSVLSPSGTLGMNRDYPVLTVTGRVAATTPVGTQFALTMDAASMQFTDASGAAYPASVAAGRSTPSA